MSFNNTTTCSLLHVSIFYCRQDLVISEGGGRGVFESNSRVLSVVNEYEIKVPLEVLRRRNRQAQLVKRTVAFSEATS